MALSDLRKEFGIGPSGRGVPYAIRLMPMRLDDSRNTLCAIGWTFEEPPVRNRLILGLTGWRTLLLLSCALVFRYTRRATSTTMLLYVA